MTTRFIFILLFFAPLANSKIELFSLREREELKEPEIIQEPLKEELRQPEIIQEPLKKEELRPKKIKPKENKKKVLPKEEVKIGETKTMTLEETMPFEIFEKGEIEEEKRPLWIVFSLAITSFLAIILLGLIFIHLAKGEKRVYKPLFQVPPSEMEEELKNLKQSSKMVSSKVEEIERIMPKEFIEGLKSGKFISQISKDVSASLEVKIRELSLAYQAIKKFLTQLDAEIAELSSLKGLNFKDIARQTATEFIIPLKNEFEKARISYENIISSFEQRQDGRFSTIEKRYQEVKEGLDEVHKRLVGVEGLLTSFTMFEQEPLIRTKKREVSLQASQTNREELNKLIYELADNGLSVDEIAKKTKIGKGEISLILSFRKKGGLPQS